MLAEPVKSKYPLSAVETLRGVRADAGAHELAQARAQSAAMRAELERVESAIVVARREARAEAETERERLETGSLRAVDLAWSHARARAELVREQRLLEDERRARRRTEEAERSERGAVTSLQSAEAELAAVERHRAGWQRERARLRDEREEQAALEPWNAGRFAPFRR